MGAAPNATITVARLVRAEPVTVDLDEPIERVYELMIRNRARFVAVRQGRRISAVLDREHLKQRLAAATRQLRVRDVVHPGMACLPAHATPDAALNLMRITGSAAVPVVDEAHCLIGLVTSQDLDDVHS